MLVLAFVQKDTFMQGTNSAKFYSSSAFQQLNSEIITISPFTSVMTRGGSVSILILPYLMVSL